MLPRAAAYRSTPCPSRGETTDLGVFYELLDSACGLESEALFAVSFLR